ncbi:hypothetical protein ScPMuIL_001365 [Solemya velum]
MVNEASLILIGGARCNMAVKVLEEDFPKAIALLTEIQQRAKDFTQHVDCLLKKAKHGEFSTSKGVSFLEVKYQSLLSYLMNLTYIMTKKTSGLSVQEDSAIERLVEIRTVLEKMRPIDQKLKYQIDKLVKTSFTGAADLSDPLRHKPHPDLLVSKMEGGESDSGPDEDEKPRKSKLYVPPKLVAMHYDGDDTLKDREERKQKEQKRKVLNSTMMQDLKDEYYDGPQEIMESRDLHRMKANKRAKDRKEYEEDHFVRLTVSKKERNAGKKMMTMSALDGLTQFDDVSALMGEDGYEGDAVQGKKRKLGKKGRKGKKGFKKRRTF